MNTEQENAVPPGEESDKPFSQKEINDDEQEIICSDPYKAAMLKALVRSLGIVSYAATEAGIARQTHYNWLKTDIHYRESVDLINEVTLDFAEGRLFRSIKESDLRAIMFVLRTRGRSRGYSMFKNELAKQSAVINIIVKDEETAELIRKNKESD